MRKRLIVATMLFLLMVLSIVLLSACEEPVVEPPRQFTVTYTAGEGGYIKGNETQIVIEGENALEVIATPFPNYKFVKWSDNDSTVAERIDTNVVENIEAVAVFELIQSFSVSYTASEGGYIKGNETQTVSIGGNSLKVVAVPFEGYKFLKWLDNDSTETERTDKNVTSNISAMAIFERVGYVFSYNYNNYTSTTPSENILLKFDSLETTALTVPESQHAMFNGWFLDEEFSIQASDETGVIIIGSEIFDSKQKNLYAKWTPNEVITYKVLMVFVTRIQVSLETIDGTWIDVDYTMSDVERQICETIPQQISSYLNSFFDGLVLFEVDTYFTTEILGRESFSRGNSSGRRTYYIFGNDIPEISGMVDDYRSVVTTISMNDYKGLLHTITGVADKKYACVHLDSLLRGLYINYEPFEWLFDTNYYGFEEYWDFINYIYLHEFTHTCERALGVYHSVEKYYNNKGLSRIEITKLFLQNKALVDDVYLGIPFSYWEGTQ